MYKTYNNDIYLCTYLYIYLKIIYIERNIGFLEMSPSFLSNTA